ncbi:hypothetical protein PIB30_082173, partial [Stylosanthes scabra]|nr:hypothetical protein [Stylosanthes scabra]
MRGKPTAHVPESRLDKPKRDQDFYKPHSSTHKRPRICVEGALAASNHARPTPKPFMHDSKFTRPRIGVGVH